MGGNAERGVTLVELVVSIVVVAIAVGAVVGVLARTAGHSADAMVLAQAVSIAESYLEEITLKAYADPDGVGGETRANFDDVGDYNGLVEPATDQFGGAIPALSKYRVSVTVTTSSALTSVPAADAKRIDVTVSYPLPTPTASISLSAYKTKTT